MSHALIATTHSFIGAALIKLGDVTSGRRLLHESYEKLREKLGAGRDQTREALARLASYSDASNA